MENVVSFNLHNYKVEVMLLRFSEQGKSGPGFPLIVCASDIFGGNPIWFPCFSTSSTSLCHHSPVTQVKKIWGE